MSTRSSSFLVYSAGGHRRSRARFRPTLLASILGLHVKRRKREMRAGTLYRNPEGPLVYLVRNIRDAIAIRLTETPWERSPAPPNDARSIPEC